MSLAVHLLKDWRQGAIILGGVLTVLWQSPCMDRLHSVEVMAEWSAWVPLGVAVAAAPLEPVVYMAREGSDGAVVYVEMAGERRGRGIRGRLTVYSRGKAVVSGLGEVAMDRALADPRWLEARLADVEAGRPVRAVAWGRLALERADLRVRWAVAPDRAAAMALESAVLAALADADLRNRRREARSL